MTKSIRIFRSLIFSALAVMVFAIANHWIKSEVITREEKLTALRADIITEERRIMVLEADWAHLTRPARIEYLSRQLLSFAPIEANRILTLDTIDKGGLGNATTPAGGLFRVSGGGLE